MGSFPFKDPDDARYEGPTLFIRGTRSRYINDDALPVIGSFFPRFELRDIDCGHWVISEKPVAFKEGRTFFSIPSTCADPISGGGLSFATGRVQLKRSFYISDRKCRFIEICY